MTIDKYTHAIELMNAVPGGEHYSKASEDLIVEACARWDELYTFIYANFERPSTYHQFGEFDKVAHWAYENNEAYQDIADVYDLLRKHKQTEVFERLTCIPPEYRDTVFPVAIARYLLAYKVVPIWPDRVTTFDEFHSRYGVMVVESTRMQSRQPRAA